MWRKSMLCLAMASACAAPEGGPWNLASVPPLETGEIESLEGATAERPCAEATVANLQLANGNQMSFCAYPDGLVVLSESGPLGRGSYLAELGVKEPEKLCAVDLYLAVADPELEVPERLFAACAKEKLRRTDYASRRFSTHGVFQAIRPEADDRSARASYCNAQGAANFAAERCLKCKPYDDCDDWCITDAWGWHLRNFAGWMGEEGNQAWETNASCGGITRVRGYQRDDVGDSWGSPKYDYNLAAGYWRHSGMKYDSIAIFGQDYDFRLRAESAAGAFHRHSGVFIDD